MGLKKVINVKCIPLVVELMSFKSYYKGIMRVLFGSYSVKC